jgi:hypothetical protein
MILNVSEADNYCSVLALLTRINSCMACDLPNSYKMVMNTTLSENIYQKNLTNRKPKRSLFSILYHDPI